MVQPNELKYRIIKRFAVELSATIVILAAFLIFRDSTDILLGLSAIYVICLAVIYGFKKAT